MRERRAGRLEPKKEQTDEEYIKENSLILESGCWEWLKSKNNGYGKLMRHGKSWVAHRFSYEVFIGKIPEENQINHVCHNRGCVNPEHLYAGTQKENMFDMDEAGRRNQVRGERDGNNKITKDEAIAIFNSSGTAKTIARKFNVSQSLVYVIRKKLVWRHIHENET